jgi:dihydrofolate synthase/folylpolyglutamate synthase
MLEVAGEISGSVDERAVRQGLRMVTWEGRLERIDEYPIVLLDGAHNPAASVVLAGYLQEYLVRAPDSRIILVWGMMRDKDHRGFIEPLLPLISELVLTEAGLARAATVQELQGVLPEWRGSICAVRHPVDALMAAKSRARPRDLICVTGSLMLLGDVKAAVRGCGLSPIRG